MQLKHSKVLLTYLYFMMKCDTLIHKTDIKVHFICKSGRQ